MDYDQQIEQIYHPENFEPETEMTTEELEQLENEREYESN